MILLLALTALFTGPDNMCDESYTCLGDTCTEYYFNYTKSNLPNCKLPKGKWQVLICENGILQYSHECP